jgi:restriction system protein
MYQIELSHPGLHKHRIIRGRDSYVVEQKANLQRAAWDEQWEKKNERLSREAKVRDGKFEAEEQTREATELLEILRSILAHTLKVDDRIDWESLKNKKQFSDPKPPEPNWSEYEVKTGFWDMFIPGLRKKKTLASQKAKLGAEDQWKNDRKNWERRREQFTIAQMTANRAIDEQAARYRAGERGAIEEYCDLVLSRSIYPDFFPKEYVLTLDQPNSTLGIEYEIPSPDEFPKVKEVRYIASRDELKETLFRETEIRQLYDSVIYQLCLRTIHEIFESDTIQAIKNVSFNGWVDAISPSTGHRARGCILSIVVSRSDFEKIRLEAVDPKACFRALKGVSASQLSGLVPIAPVLSLNRNDARFVVGSEVQKDIRAETNLAAIGWEEFEHLIREVFEKEFRAAGGEVRITRASRDEGVDAVVFDPDPIRGGKIIIQAKRYTNTVGVGAVRDLYGTIMNEGATKGILVTTSQFGPDSHQFAADKPITLLDGSNLLHLLSKHGTAARIDLAEAKKLGIGLRRSRDD